MLGREGEGGGRNEDEGREGESEGRKAKKTEEAYQFWHNDSTKLKG